MQVHVLLIQVLGEKYTTMANFYSKSQLSLVICLFLMMNSNQNIKTESNTTLDLVKQSEDFGSIWTRHSSLE